jgi:hypothetical protein
VVAKPILRAISHLPSSLRQAQHLPGHGDSLRVPGGVSRGS